MDVSRESRRTVDLHPSDPDQSDQSLRSDRSVGSQMERMELSSGEVVLQPAAATPRPPADDAMDQQCMSCAVCRIIVSIIVFNTPGSIDPRG